MNKWERRETKKQKKKNKIPQHGKSSQRIIGELDRIPPEVYEKEKAKQKVRQRRIRRKIKESR